MEVRACGQCFPHEEDFCLIFLFDFFDLVFLI